MTRSQEVGEVNELSSSTWQILVSKTEVHIQMKVHQKSIQGPKRDMAVLHAEVLQEANDAREKFKFYKGLESCGWVVRTDPGERANIAAFELAESASATGPLAQGEATTAYITYSSSIGSYNIYATCYIYNQNFYLLNVSRLEIVEQNGMSFTP